ncbi:hypothetical protein K501DRAFT_338268 [Backusella circina FSU 941]|nr:hypothetical protein K501DRAFT_338268 [Backusella circina FSU 941]
MVMMKIGVYEESVLIDLCSSGFSSGGSLNLESQELCPRHLLWFVLDRGACLWFSDLIWTCDAFDLELLVCKSGDLRWVKSLDINDLVSTVILEQWQYPHTFLLQIFLFIIRDSTHTTYCPTDRLLIDLHLTYSSAGVNDSFRYGIITLPIQVFPRQSGPKLEVGSPAIAPLWLLLFRLR